MTPAATKPVSTEASVVTPSTEAGPSPVSAEPTDPAHRHVMISEAAFFIAQARGFTPSRELDDWLAAEREIDQRLSNPDH